MVNLHQLYDSIGTSSAHYDSKIQASISFYGYAFVVLNIVQGAFIMCYHCLQNERVSVCISFVSSLIIIKIINALICASFYSHMSWNFELEVTFLRLTIIFSNQNYCSNGILRNNFFLSKIMRHFFVENSKFFRRDLFFFIFQYFFQLDSP